MTSYTAKIPATVELALEEQGFDRSADVVPSRAGVPVATRLSPEDWHDESSKFFDAGELDPAKTEDAKVLDDLATS